ncbi:hypothetical protein L1887_20614 [Cichorium endivia]|nr:hypothetical protein L1887_20614 [Cichorium endivia]
MTLSGGEDEDDSLVCRRRYFKIQYRSAWSRLRFLKEYAGSRRDFKIHHVLPPPKSVATDDLDRSSYVGVGKNEEVELFYYFVESQRNPQKDPLLLYLTGGPGTSGIVPFLFQIDFEEFIEQIEGVRTEK